MPTERRSGTERRKGFDVDAEKPHMRMPPDRRRSSDVTAPTDTDALVALRLELEYWEHRLRRYKNRNPAWVTAAKAALTAAQQSGAPCCGKFSECSQPCSPRADYWQEKATLCDEFAAQQKVQEDGWPLLFARFIARTKSVIKSDRMIPHDEGTRLSWIETKNGQGICDITNEEYFAILDLMRSPLPPLPKESEK